MASRQTAGTTSAFQYAGGQAGSTQVDIALSSDVPVTGTALNSLVGTTINGLVVGALELWADGAVWDTGNNRFLRPGSDYDVSLLHRSGFGG